MKKEDTNTTANINKPVLNSNTSSNMVIKKVLVIIGLTIGLLIPLGQISNQVQDRKFFETEAKDEISKGWGKDVNFGYTFLDSNDKPVYPYKAESTIHVVTQEKKRGVFFVPVYTASLTTKITFKKPEAVLDNKKDIKTKGVGIPEQDHLIVTIETGRSLQNFRIKNLITGKELKAKKVSGGLRVNADQMPDKNFFDVPLEIEISYRGTGPLTYTTKADEDVINMTGNWTKPKFIEEIFPNHTTVSNQGFKAFWTIQTIPKINDDTRDSKSIGISHVWSRTDYAKIERAVKYGQLFITLTFLLIFVLEFLSKAKIHPLQYGLIGLSISVFYILLLALAEVIGFDWAYIASSVATTMLIVFYIIGFLNNKKYVRLILAEQIILSAFFYTLLALEERAFLVGSIGLFVALALFMVVTRKFDWYVGSFKTKPV